MSGPARAGLFLYARDLGCLADFYQSFLGMARLHASDELVVLESQDVQLIVHQIPLHIASGITITTPPTPREDSALKFFFTVPSISNARSMAVELGGGVLDGVYQGRGFRASNAWDPEGNIFQVRESAA